MSSQDKRHATLTTADLSKLSVDDRMAVMNMVKEGELSVEDAINKVKGKTGTDKANTLSKAAKMLTGKNNLRRQGAMRQNRGRLYLEISVQKASAFSVLIVHVKEGRDLVALKKETANPHVKLFITPDLEKPSLKKSNVRKNTLNPMFNEQFTWEIRTGSDLESAKLHIQVVEQDLLRRSQFMGSMAFPLAEVFEAVKMTGWFRLLDAQKGEFQFIPYRPVVKDDSQASTRKPRSSVLNNEAARQTEKAVASQEAAGQPAAAATPAKAAPAPPSPALTPVQAPPATASNSTTPPNKSNAQKKMALAEINHSSFTYLKVLGQGSFGKVLMAEHKATQEIFAVKILKKEVVVEDDDVECTMIERRVLALANGCPFLTNLVATFQTPDRLYFVMEFVTGGDLMFHIQKQKRFSPDLTAFYAGEICLGLWYLHKNGVLYRDLKLDNVMLDGTGHIKIADFGMCKESIWGAATTTTFCGTPGYLAPEIIKEQPYGASVDWWSLGVLIFEMLVGDSPFEGEDEEELFDQILHKKVAYPSRLDANAKSLLDGFLNRDPKTRLGCGRTGRDDLRAHPFFAKIDWAKLETREVDPPGYKPDVKNPRAADCFDPEFTEANPGLSPSDPYAIANIDQNVFRDFSFTNKNFFGGESEAAAKEAEASRRPALFDYAWYRPDLPRDDAAKALKGKEVGTFFVRESSTQPGCYAVAMVSEGNKIWNGLITPSVTDDGRTLYKLFVKQKFGSLPELIEYYYSHPVTTAQSGKKLCLARPS